MNQAMNSYTDNYEGVWKDKMGNCLEIKVIDDYHCSVTFILSGQETPLRRPWFNDQPAIDMLGSYDPQYGPSLDIELAEKGTGFFLSIDFDFTLNDYQEMVPSIIRNEEDAFLDQYYHLLGPLDRFIKLAPQGYLWVYFLHSGTYRPVGLWVTSLLPTGSTGSSYGYVDNIPVAHIPTAL